MITLPPMVARKSTIPFLVVPIALHGDIMARNHITDHGKDLTIALLQAQDARCTKSTVDTKGASTLGTSSANVRHWRDCRSLPRRGTSRCSRQREIANLKSW
jgi:hypothetical protein